MFGKKDSKKDTLKSTPLVNEEKEELEDVGLGNEITPVKLPQPKHKDLGEPVVRVKNVSKEFKIAGEICYYYFFF